MPVFRRVSLVASLLALLGAAPPPSLPANNPKVLNDLFQCRSITDDSARLACFDKAAGQIATAADHGDVRMVDREQVNRTRRALFGFSLPTIDLFGDHKVKPGKVDDDEIKEITAKVSGVGTGADGGYVLTLDDGSRWEQTDNVTLGRTPRPGNDAVIRRGVLGSYKMIVEKGPAMKVRRIE